VRTGLQKKTKLLTDELKESVAALLRDYPTIGPKRMIWETVGANASKKDKESIKRFLSKSETETAPTISTIKHF
jgi:hypothetical protein